MCAVKVYWADENNTKGEIMQFVNGLALTLLIIGGLNWGLIGVFEFDLVAAIFGPMTLLSKIVYTLVGVSAVYSIFLLKPFVNTYPRGVLSR